MKFREFVNPTTLMGDLSAGLVLGIQSIPSGMAVGLLALVNPIYGVYAYMTGVFTGALFTSSVLMAVQGTSAMALVIASVPQVTAGNDPNSALFALSIIIGVIMLVAGLLKFGSLTRFVPNSVMVGFINGIAILIILGQLDDFTGYDSAGANKLANAIDLFRNLNMIDLRTVMIGLLTIILILTLEKTALKALGMVVALIAAAMVSPLLDWDSVALVKDVASIPGSLPRPVLPPLSVFPGLLIPALSVAFVGLMQGASISQTVPNPDGKFPDVSRDFTGQGIANLVAGLFQGMPVGGSMSATGIITGAEAKSRLANLSAGVVIALAILLFGKYVEFIAMPSLAGLLILIGFRMLKIGQMETVWKTGLVQQTVMLITFVSTLFIPLQFAVILGVALAVVLYVFKQSNKVVVKEWRWEPGELPIESDAPAILPSNRVTVLRPYGSLFFAAAPVFEGQLPEISDETRHAVVVISLRGKPELGSTLMEVLERYAKDLQEHESKLMLSGVDSHVRNQIRRTGLLKTIGHENVFMATEAVGESAIDATYEGEAWIEVASRE